MFNESMTVGQILENPTLKAVVDKHVPGWANSPILAIAKGMSISQVRGMIPADMKEKFEAAIAEIKTHA